MRCPKCGTVMNRHAEKPVRDYRESDGPADEVMGAILLIHACPGCGKVEAVHEAAV